MNKKLPPNFLKFFSQEFKRLSDIAKSGHGQLGADPKNSIIEMAERAKKAIKKDMDEKHIESDIVSQKLEGDEEDPKIIKESGSKHPIK
tara:strand:+ start:342 stop:608 length:267 start_codon:yes stop_codon:yes gene_type:complete